MTKIEIKETGKIESITVIDSKTGIDCSEDLIGNADPEIEGYNVDGNMIMTKENFVWWYDYCNRYEKANNSIYDFFQNLKTNCWNRNKTENAYIEFEKMELVYDNYIKGIEFNDIPNAIVSFLKKYK